jgi:hypothetical protein
MTYDRWKTTNPNELGSTHADDGRQLEIWTVYRHPRDYPDKFVARKSLATTPEPTHTNDMFVADNLDEVRALLPKGLHRLPRVAEDDPVIVEVWL